MTPHPPQAVPLPLLGKVYVWRSPMKLVLCDTVFQIWLWYNIGVGGENDFSTAVIAGLIYRLRKNLYLEAFISRSCRGGTSFCLQQQKEAKVPQKDCVLLTPLALCGRFSDGLKL